MKPSPSKSLKTVGGKKRSREEAARSAMGTSPPVSTATSLQVEKVQGED
jgi:hypothetical protein